MVFEHMSWTAIIAAAICGFLAGALYYGILGKVWMKAAGLTENEIKPNGKVDSRPFVAAIAANFVFAIILAGLIGHVAEVTLINGLFSAILVVGGFVIPSMAVNYGFQQKSAKLVLIDAGHWLCVFLVQGAVIGQWGEYRF